MDLFDRGRIPSASPTRQQPQQTDPLLTVDPSIGLAPIQFMGLAAIEGKSPMEGLEAYKGFATASMEQQRQRQAQTLAQSQEQRMQQQAQQSAQEFEWQKAQRPMAERAAQLEIAAAEMDLQSTQLQMQEARQKLESQGGVDPKITQQVITDATRAAMDMLKDRVGPDGLTPLPPTTEEVIKLRNTLARDQFMTMFGQSEQVTPWESYTPEQQASYARDFPDLLKKYYPDVYGRMIMEGRIQ
ncbi:MAG: hypothetical protein HC888_07325 [Candidatus Competibacteraceae bacterium]|nr:hypothetical protein [Candidatus Competibacteraceae bacterium]